MNVNPLSTPDPFAQSIIARTLTEATSTSGNVDPASFAMPQDSSPQLSPFARILSTLQQLQQTDPAKYQQVTSQIATNLQDAAKMAASNDNTSQAAELNQLATDFANASKNNTLPNVQDLAQAIGAGHGHRHRHHMHAPSSDSTGQNSFSTPASSTNATGSISSNSSGNTTSTVPDAALSQLSSQFLANSTLSTQNSQFDPLSIITNTLSEAGLS